MLKYFKLILIVSMVLMFSACADKRIILMPQSEYYPTFPTDDFTTSTSFKLETWEESEVINGKTNTYMVVNKPMMLQYIKRNKQLSSNYNLLLTKIKKFNNQIDKRNQEQNSKKPFEVK